jgi:hypothetical protein
MVGVVAQSRAATIQATSPAYTNVASAIGLAKEGDTVTIPAGTASWTTTLTVTKAITLQGAGIGQTIILDNMPAKAPNPQSLLVINTVAGKHYTLGGIEFRPDPSGRLSSFSQGCLKITGFSHFVRVHDVKFDSVRNRALYVSGAVYGVIDHCNFQNARHCQGLIYIAHSDVPGPNGQAGSYGDGSWSTPTNLGGPDFLFFEDCVMNNPNTDGDPALTDGNGGNRIVLRHNTIHNMNVQGHGTGSTGRTRSIRALELYQNNFSYTPALGAVASYIRGGTGIIWGNTLTAANPASCFTFINFRAGERLYIWNGDDGTSKWDLNDSRGIYLNGAAGAGSSGQSLVVAGANFAVNQWRGYVVLNLDQPYDTNNGHFTSTMATVISNTSNTIKVGTAPHPVATQKWNAGNRFEIRKVTKPLDMVGNGPGDYLGGGLNPTPRWLNQASEPYYLWANYNNGKLQGGNGSSPDVVKGTHFIENGTTPKPGYTPYTYPHPLTSDIQPPTNLSIISGP